MMKPKAALVKSGFLPKGSENKRGRMSAAAIAECERLVTEEGYQIEGFSLATASVGSTAPREVERVKVVPGEKVIADLPAMRHDPDVWQAYCNVDGKIVEPLAGPKTVCNVCRNSLPYCPCRSPRVWVAGGSEAMVNFRQR